jgi:uncharacterized membrane protein
MVLKTTKDRFKAQAIWRLVGTAAAQWQLWGCGLALIMFIRILWYSVVDHGLSPEEAFVAQVRFLAAALTCGLSVVATRFISQVAFAKFGYEGARSSKVGFKPFIALTLCSITGLAGAAISPALAGDDPSLLPMIITFGLYVCVAISIASLPAAHSVATTEK